MEQVIDFLTRWLTAFFDVLRGGVASVISVFDWPAEVTGIPPEIIAVFVLCGMLLALWRAMGGYLT
jgi:hypothetical protein